MRRNGVSETQKTEFLGPEQREICLSLGETVFRAEMGVEGSVEKFIQGFPPPFGQKKSWGVTDPCTSVVCVFGGGVGMKRCPGGLHRGRALQVEVSVSGKLSELTQGWDKIEVLGSGVCRRAYDFQWRRSMDAAGVAPGTHHKILNCS